MSFSEKRVRDDRVLLDLLADKWTIHVKVPADPGSGR
jgi:hypothetical protein